MTAPRSGPLTGLTVVEFAGLGPAPYGAMLLADLGADVVCIHRPGGAQAPITSIELPLNRGRSVVELDLRTAEDLERAKGLVTKADVLIEGFRPGVMERLGLGPEELHRVNSGLIYARMTGWGQSGPLAQTAGHDLNYLAISGSLNAIGPAAGPPTVPLNLIGDFGGGGMMLAFGIMAALWERSRSGIGQVIDAAIVDGVASLSTMILGYLSVGRWQQGRFNNRLDGANPCYTTYETADGRFVAVAALEGKFFNELVSTLGLNDLPDRESQENWPALRQTFAAVFAARTRDDWAAIFNNSDACVSPVLSWEESALHAHIAERGSIHRNAVGLTSNVVPRFSRTPGAPLASVELSRLDLEQVLDQWIGPSELG